MRRRQQGGEAGRKPPFTDPEEFARRTGPVGRKRGGGLPPQFKKKKAPPFESKVEGGNARHRADRKAQFKRGGRVEALADAEPSSSKQRHVPPGGAEAVDQKFQFGGRVTEHSMRSQYHGGPQRMRTTTTTTRHRDPHPVTGLKKGGAEHRQAGGNVPTPRPDPRSFGERLRDSPETLGRIAGEAIRSKHGGHISTAQRKALPSGDFALPGQGKGAGGKGPGSYPIDTENRARNALARGKQHAGGAKLAEIKRKVKAKYPDMEVS